MKHIFLETKNTRIFLPLVIFCLLSLTSIAHTNAFAWQLFSSNGPVQGPYSVGQPIEFSGTYGAEADALSGNLTYCIDCGASEGTYSVANSQLSPIQSPHSGAAYRFTIPAQSAGSHTITFFAKGYTGQMSVNAQLSMRYFTVGNTAPVVAVAGGSSIQTGGYGCGKAAGVPASTAPAADDVDNSWYYSSQVGNLCRDWDNPYKINSWHVKPGPVTSNGTTWSWTCYNTADRYSCDVDKDTFSCNYYMSNRGHPVVCSAPVAAPVVAAPMVDTGSVTVTPTPTVILSVDQTSIQSGGSARLTWSSTNATACSAPWMTQSSISGTQSVTPTTSTTYSITCTGTGGTSPVQSVTVAVTAVPDPTVTVTADSTNLSYNTGTTLRWSSTNASSCTASDGWTGSKAVTGSEATVNLTASKTFTLVCSNSIGKTVTQSVVVNVQPAPKVPTVTLSASSNSLAYNSATTLSWTSTDATACSAPWMTNPTISGSFSTGLLTTSKSYSITCTGPGGQSGDTANIAVAAQVIATPVVAPLSTVALDVPNSSIAQGQSTSLRWSSTNAVACSAPFTTQTSTSGTQSVTPSTSTIYRISCRNADGVSSSQSVTVTVSPLPTATLDASKTTITQGDSTTLTWSSTNASTCSAPFTTQTSTGGTQSVTPSTTTTYTITCTGSGGVATQPVTVTVGARAVTPPPTVSLDSSKASIAQGQAVSLVWSSSNANTCSAPWMTNASITGTQSVTPSTTNTYTITCTGSGGSSSQSVTVTVSPLPTATLDASKTTITQGDSTTLTWSSTNASTCSAPFTTQTSTGGTQSVTPSTTTTYTITCTGSGGVATQPVTVTVNTPPQTTQVTTQSITLPPPPKLTFTTTPSAAAYDGSTLLSWSSTNTTSCRSTGGDWTAGDKGVTGTQTFTNLKSDKVFVLTCTGSGGDITISAGVSVAAAPVVTTQNVDTTQVTTTPNVIPTTPNTTPQTTPITNPTPTAAQMAGLPTLEVQTISQPSNEVMSAIPPRLVFYIKNPKIEANTPVTLVWSSSDADNCIASGDWDKARGVSGEYTTPPLTSSKNYVLTCIGPGGKISGFGNIDFRSSPPPTISFTANPTNLVYGQPITLAWSTTNSKFCNASGDWSGARTTEGSYSTEPITTGKKFKITCNGPGGQFTQTISIGTPPKNVATSNVKPKTTVVTQPTIKETDTITPSIDLTYTTKVVKGKKDVFLTWTTKNVRLCTSYGGWKGAKSISGSEDVGPMIVGSKYALTCKGDYTVSKSVTIKK